MFFKTETEHSSKQCPQKEEKIKKEWLLSLYSLLFGATLLSIFWHFDELYEMLKDPYLAPRMLCGFFLTSLFVFFACAILYHCAYKKRGTDLLLFIVLVWPLWEFFSLTKTNGNQISFFLLASSLALKSFWWVNCVRLYRINSARKYQLALACKEDENRSTTI